MLRSLRSALARFAVRRAAACQRQAPKRADLWLRLGCALAPTFAESHPALVRLRRAIEDRWGAVAAAQQAAQRFPENPDAWMLLGEAWQMVFRQQDALVAYEQVLTLEERRSEEHTSELQSLAYLVCRLLLEKKKLHPSHHRLDRPFLYLMTPTI